MDFEFDLSLEISHLSFHFFMPEIIPAIIPVDFADLKKRMELVEPYVSTVQFDVMDGVFVPNKTWNTPEDLLKLETKLKLEAHILVENPHLILNDWLKNGVSRIILHWEAIEKINNYELLLSELIREAHRNNKEFGIGLNPQTSIDVLENFINKIDIVVLMSVDPGFAGQKFQEAVIPKIKQLRQRHPDVKIEIDGGVNLDNIEKLIKAGADFFAVGSAIFGSSDIGERIESFKNIINKN